MSPIIAWNCRGIGVASTVRALRDLVSQHTPYFVFLSETKARKKKIDNLCRMLTFDHVFSVDAVGRSGGVAMLWNNSVDVTILKYCRNYIHAKIMINDMNIFCYFTGVYGDPDPNLRKRVWDDISN